MMSFQTEKFGYFVGHVKYAWNSFSKYNSYIALYRIRQSNIQAVKTSRRPSISHLKGDVFLCACWY